MSGSEAPESGAAPRGPSPPDLDVALAAALVRHGRQGRVALRGDGGQLGYAELGERVASAAARLRDLGLRDGATVVIVAEKHADVVVALLAALRAGHCACIVEPRLPTDELAARIAEFGIDHVLAGSRRYADLAPAVGVPVTRLATVVRSAGGRASSPARPAPERAALMLFTSGSTGRPKAIRLSRTQLLANADGVVAHTCLTPDDRLLHLMPLHHTNGINNQLFAPLLAGASVALIDRFRADRVTEQLARYRATIITGVPTMFLRILPHLGRRERLTSLRLLRCGSAPLTTAQHEQIETAFGVPLIQSYGLSEATCTSTMNPLEAPRRGTVGTPLAGQQISIRDPASGAIMPTGQVGEICIAGPTVMSGYVGHSDTAPVRDGVLHTGDLGMVDSDGYLSVTGRLKEMILRGGENLAPGAIEAALSTHPMVAEVAVVAAPHPDLGEVPAAFVVPAARDSILDHDQLREYVVQRLGRAHQPEYIATMRRLPLNPMGKVNKNALRRKVGDG
ncbi:acyl-CoA synthetase (AMP-forming)/AMP-acid ligase II [Tamaricihabitans halophyticus]|uniref:Acyl-CoA synthetase (AMP-forming)/AMP-acid ligase II n=1 Tax=Tamaricihabitans halophyticus TaxID=1262583 RepID=A0A4R2QHK4_9PSEU|nr:class I adenylate-forming enzyme family protein [Tamaricihabitans halophyticus]TCP47838.1 acyl-CoA synthetase (AMP-forming)/AMP-acid ligase II [Tamaricihabitans halophyticus]